MKTSAIALRSSHEKPKTGKKKLIEVSFEPAEGGVISKTRHRMDGDEYGPSETKTGVHTAIENAVNHLMVTMEGCFKPSGMGNKPAEGKSK